MTGSIMFVITHSVELTVRGQWTKSNVRLVKYHATEIGCQPTTYPITPVYSSVNSESLFPFAFRNKPPPVFRLPYSEHDFSQTNLSSTKIMWMGLSFRYWIGEGFLVTDKRLYTLRCRAVPPSVPPSKIFMNCERFMQYCSCPTVRDWIAVYPALSI